MRRKLLVADFVPVGQVLAASSPLRFAIGAELYFERIRLFIELAFHVAAKIEIASMCDAFEFTVLAWGQEWKCVFDVSSAS